MRGAVVERRTESAAREVLRCWEDGDGAGYRALAAPEVRYREAAGGEVSGAGAVVGAWQPLRAAYPDLGAEVLDLRVCGTTALLAVVWRAVQSAPAGDLPPTYRRLVVGDVVALEWAGGRLVREWHRPGVLGPLGLLRPGDPAVPVGVPRARPA